MTGKPTVDLLVGADDMAEAHRVATQVELLGYENLGEVFVPGRIYLRRRGSQHFNVLIAVKNGDMWRILLLMRDYLRSSPDDVAAYSQSKLAAVESGAKMFFSYSHGKGPFLAELLQRAMQWARLQSGTTPH